jgi:hypothetical protein
VDGGYGVWITVREKRRFKYGGKGRELARVRTRDAIDGCRARLAVYFESEHVVVDVDAE